MKLNLLCTFIQKNDLELALTAIKNQYEIKNDSVFVFSNKKFPKQLYCTFNVFGEYDLIHNTILLHRKSETNTLYTINALNELIKRINNGLLDTKFVIDWENYRNSLILMQKDYVEIHSIELNEIIKLND